MTRSKQTLTNLFIVRKDGSTGVYRSNYNNNRDKGIKRLKANILEGKEKGKWEIAYLYDAQNADKKNALICCFHYSSGSVELDKITAEKLRIKYKNIDKHFKYFAYCIPTTYDQVKRSKSPYSIRVLDEKQALEEMTKNGLYKVQLYTKQNKLHKVLTNHKKMQ